MARIERLSIDRRAFVVSGVGFLGLSGAAAAQVAVEDVEPYPGFPSQDRALVRAVVGKSHTDLEAVRELVTRSPALARAAIDWGFGDWESAIGAAAHMGRRDIAAVLLEHGARADLFTHAMLGHLDVVRAAVEASPGIQRVRGPHSFSLLHHARHGGDDASAVVRYLEGLGDADLPVGNGVASDEELANLPGAYAYGKEENARLIVTVQRGSLRVERPGEFPRSLARVADGVFHPMGAEHVRVTFGTEGGVRTLTVHDPEPIVTAYRVSG